MKQNDILSTLTGALIPLPKKLSIVKCSLSLIFAIALFALVPKAAQAQTITFNPNLANGYTVLEGHNITLTVNAGAGVTYQWHVIDQNGDRAVTNGGVYSGATTSTLTLTKAPFSLNGNRYYCTATAGSRSANSNTTRLTVTPAVGFKVTEDPVGAIYTQSTVVYATMLTARFEYKSSEGFIDASKPIKGQWYWSNTNSTTDRSNGQGETSIYGDQDVVIYSTT